MYRKLNLDRDKVDVCRGLAERVFVPVHRFVEQHSTTSLETASLALCGVENAEKVTAFFSREQLQCGVFPWPLRVMQSEQCSLLEACNKILAKKVACENLPELNVAEVKNVTRPFLDELQYRLEVSRNVQQSLSRRYLGNNRPLKAVKMACVGANDFELHVREVLELNVQQLDQLHCSFADLPLAQMDAVFAKLRRLADEHARVHNRYVRIGVSVDLPSAEVAVLAFKHRLEVLHADLLHDFLFAQVHPHFAVVEHAFMRCVAAKAGTTILGREADMLGKIDVYRYGHQALGSMLMNESFARHYHVPAENIMLTHAFQLSPDIEDAWLFELAQAQLLREHFTKQPLLLRCDHFHSALPANFYQADLVLAELLSFISEQSVLEFNADQHLQADVVNHLKQIDYFSKVLRTVGDELSVTNNGKIARRAHTVLENAEHQLKKLEQVGFFEALSQKVFQGHETQDASHLVGAGDFFQKDRLYLNPVLDLLKSSAEEERC